MTVTTEIVRGSELKKIITKIAVMRDASLVEKQEQYLADLKTYRRRLGKRREVDHKLTESSGGEFSLSFSRKARGFFAKHLGQDVFVPRPEAPRRPWAWLYTGYSREHIMGEYVTHAHDAGLLAGGGLYNRTLLPRRVEDYKAQMQAGVWEDLLSDPITISKDGQVLNGQHRIAAAEDVDWSKATNDPAFLVVWGADPQEARFTDCSKRTQKDTTTIADKLIVNAARN